MKIYERLRKHYDLILSLLKELNIEKSYRGIERLVQLIIQAVLDLGLMAITALKKRSS